MEIVTINGKAKRVFVLGTRRFLAPEKIGAGRREYVERIKAEGAVSMDKFKSRLQGMNIRTQLQSEAALQEMIVDAMSAALNDANSMATSPTLAILRAILEPEDGQNLTLEEWIAIYMDDATEEQVQEVADFFEGRSPTKTDGDSSTTSRGKSTARKSKASQ